MLYKQASVTYAQVEASGPASPPLGFPAPIVPQGKVQNVLCRLDSLSPPCERQVLMQSDNFDIERAYLITQQLTTTLCGEVVLALVLHKSNSQDKFYEPFITSDNQQQIVAIKKDRRSIIRQMHDNNNNQNQQHPENPWKEVAAMQLLQNANNNHYHHPNILPLLDVLYDETFLYEIFPYCNGGSLYDLINHHYYSPNGWLPENQARIYFQQILNGIDYLHSKGICHRDISTQNILLMKTTTTSTNTKTNTSTERKEVTTNSNELVEQHQHDEYCCVLMDFGMCVRIPYPYPDDPHTEDVTDVTMGTMRRIIHSQSHCGKLRFMAPEMYHQNDFDGLSVDLWSAAVILFVMLTGRHPYERPNDRQDAGYHDLLDAKYYWDPQGVDQVFSWGHTVSTEAVDLLQHMFHPNPRDRFTLAQVMQHPWLVRDDMAKK